MIHFVRCLAVNFALIVVLFILLIIVGVTFVKN
ncbi:YjcZ family sporulation protein [Neobacillus sp. SuZ13]|nr:YjcZ family sporulation protein [Neobacillus sp. SuZ13]WHY69619.1 YjcZ family sporulation protein [Neobacillus sp. SuZ13]